MPKKYMDIDISNGSLSNRNLFLFEEVGERAIKNLIEKMLILDDVNNKPINLYINSSGGGNSDGYALIDAMSNLTSKVNTYIVGYACSMAGIISIYGDKRYMSKHGVWMGHPGSGGVNGEDYDYMIKARIKMLDIYCDMVTKSLTNHTKLTKEDIALVNKSELWLNAEQALKKGIIDKII